jgi:hypothetical protein
VTSRELSAFPARLETGDYKSRDSDKPFVLEEYYSKSFLSGMCCIPALYLISTIKVLYVNQNRKFVDNS